MRLLVAGSRSIDDVGKVEHILSNASYIFDRNVALVLHGGARGVDTIAGEWARRRGYDVREYPADWNTHGKSAGYIRNVEMVANCDAAIVLWNGTSKGTRHTLDQLEKYLIRHVVVMYP